MSKYLKMLNLHMFDGATAGGAEAGGSGEGAAEASAEPTVVYGKAEEGAEAGQGGTGTEEGEEEETEDLGAEFEELITGKYKQQFGDRVSGIIQNRFKNAQDYQGELQQWQDATAMLAAKYGIDGSDPEALRKAIETDDGIFLQDAEAEGLTADRYRENLKLKLDADRGRSMQEEMRREAEKRQTFKRWDAEAEALKEAFPGFDLAQELQNETFTQSLNRGNDVRTSFFIAHMDEILSGSTQAAESRATHKTVENLKSRAARPAENAVSHQPAIIRKDDPSALSDKELFDVAERARRGEKIQF